MRISPIGVTRNNQRQNNVSANKVSSNTMNISKSKSSPSFGICFVDKAGKALSPDFMDKMTPTEISKFAQRVFMVSESTLKEAFGYKPESLREIIFGADNLYSRIVATGKYNKLKPYTDKLKIVHSELRQEAQRVNVPTEEMINKINTFFDTLIEYPIDKETPMGAVRYQLEDEITHHGFNGIDIFYNQPRTYDNSPPINNGYGGLSCSF